MTPLPHTHRQEVGGEERVLLRDGINSEQGQSLHVWRRWWWDSYAASGALGCLACTTTPQ